MNRTTAFALGVIALIIIVLAVCLTKVRLNETDAKVNEINADAELSAQKTLAEADKHRRTRTSEGELAKTRAQAKGEKAINEAYLGQGGQAYITRQMIDNIEFGDIEINTNKVNPFDVNQLLRMFGLDPDTFEKSPADEKKN